MVKDGIIDATFLCPTGGKEAVRFAMDILNKAEGIPKKMITPVTLGLQKTKHR